MLSDLLHTVSSTRFATKVWKRRASLLMYNFAVRPEEFFDIVVVFEHLLKGLASFDGDKSSCRDWFEWGHSGLSHD